MWHYYLVISYTPPHQLQFHERSFQEYQELSEKLQHEYEESEDDFNASDLMEKAIRDIETKFVEKENQWSARYLNLTEKTRDELLSWMAQTEVLPEYLSDVTRKKYFELRTVAEKKLSDGRIEDVLFYYKKLTEEEKTEFKKMINS